uniref:Uncharacterized protein n=1 Tax=Panagrolaimus sp. ES5 TaxID=591445 RepID=A0AC34GWX5_9BILA
MSRFFNVKNDNSAAGEKIIFDKEINVLQPEVVAALPKLRAGQEVILPIKSDTFAAVGTNENEIDTKNKSWANPFAAYITIQNPNLFSGLNEETEDEESELIENVKHLNINLSIYSSEMPLLEEHKEKLSEIWSTFQSNGIITNRRTMRRLSANKNDETYILKKIRNAENECYVLQQHFTSEDFKKPHCDMDALEKVYSTLTKTLAETAYTGYFFKSKKHRKFTFYYTSEIDAHWNSTKFEIKAVKDGKHHIISPAVAFRAAIQCFYADVKEIIYGFYNDSQITLKLFTLDQLIEIAQRGRLDVEIAKSTFRSNANQIVKFIKENGGKLLVNQNVKITKMKNQLTFDIQQL